MEDNYNTNFNLRLFENNDYNNSFIQNTENLDNSFLFDKKENNFQLKNEINLETYQFSQFSQFEFFPINFSVEKEGNDNNILLNKKRKLGRKKNNDKKYNENSHDKYSRDNLQRKIKHLAIESCINYINEKILGKIYENNYTPFKKDEFRLIKIDHNIIKNIKADYNRMLNKQTIKWICTQKKCKKYKNYEDNHNKILIEKGLKDSSGEDKKKLEVLLNMTFLEYLDIFSGKNTENNINLTGLMTLENYCETYDFKAKNPDHEEYKQYLKKYCHDYENILNKIKERKTKKKK